MLPVIMAALLFQSVSSPTWENSTIIKISTVNEWCRHCPDWNQTSYSFKLDDGTVYIAQTHKKLDVTLNGHTQLRFEKDGHVGDYLHILDDAGKDRKLRVIEKIAAEKMGRMSRGFPDHREGPAKNQTDPLPNSSTISSVSASSFILTGLLS